jgi:SagB-type dehydrogenase family enzyme
VALPEVAVPLLSGLDRRRCLEGRFGAAALTPQQLSGLLAAASGRPGVPAGAGLDRVLLLCVVHRVEGVPPGLYAYESREHRLALLRPGDLRAALAPAAQVDARFLGDHGAGAVVVPVGDYERGFRAVGDRWFPMQNLPAGIVVQRAALAAAALGLDCRVLCGYETDRLAAVLGLAPGPLRPLVQVLAGSAGTDPGHDRPL